MQFVPGLSLPQTVPVAPAPAAAGRKPNLWILDSWRDLILYVCTPLLLVPIFVGALLHAAQQGLLALAVAIAGVFLVNFVWMWVQEKRPSPVKLVLLVTSISFWWYCNNIVASVLVGSALFEVFHDVQYLSLV
jgi:uncharacterized membrane protein (UPF0136 family)